MCTGLGKVCLYTTAKCRSMTTKSEFVEMWNNCKQSIKTIRLMNGDSVFATDYNTILFFVDLMGINWHIGVFNFNNIKGIECE